MEKLENKVLLKEEILRECVIKQQSLINDFNARLDDIKDTQKLNRGNNDYGDSTISAFSELNTLRDALEFAKEEMRVLTFIRQNLKRIHITPDLGAVVITDKETFFISVSIEEFFVNGTCYFGISTHSPIYKSMRGKVAFETFTYGGSDYFIKEIF
ncbi:hypothetical protein LZF95_06115 [Algoriphagus sp. AGSA1]|uniref:hypothetical protein n=1 Tax=Algoriphagus sp. AGSA1 TaxID=2907213 RepID=UPI001F2C0E18|nr:hypothetical protein [Algoriphagus sp. AGSA1]MCE7054243.1 hypothetical protein [Algoriphagus sp. AGSA1]